MKIEMEDLFPELLEMQPPQQLEIVAALAKALGAWKMEFDLHFATDDQVRALSAPGEVRELELDDPPQKQRVLLSGRRYVGHLTVRLYGPVRYRQVTVTVVVDGAAS